MTQETARDDIHEDCRLLVGLRFHALLIFETAIAGGRGFAMIVSAYSWLPDLWTSLLGRDYRLWLLSNSKSPASAVARRKQRTLH